MYGRVYRVTINFKRWVVCTMYYVTRESQCPFQAENSRGSDVSTHDRGGGGDTKWREKVRRRVREWGIGQVSRQRVPEEVMCQLMTGEEVVEALNGGKNENGSGRSENS